MGRWGRGRGRKGKEKVGPVVGMKEKYKGRWMREKLIKGENLDREDEIFYFEGVFEGTRVWIVLSSIL
jgi:hypothetical protein